MYIRTENNKKYLCHCKIYSSFYTILYQSQDKKLYFVIYN